MKNALKWLAVSALLIIAGLVGYVVIHYLRGE